MHIGFICTGNICRSPMGEVVLRQLVTSDKAFGHTVEVSSAGTANWHVGSPMDLRSRKALDRAGFKTEGSAAQHATSEYLATLDLAIVMTREHRVDIRKQQIGGVSPVWLIRSLVEPIHELDLADPYYGDEAEFDRCLETIIQSCRELVPMLRLEGVPFSASPPAK